jgi:hypothetical protein
MVWTRPTGAPEHARHKRGGWAGVGGGLWEGEPEPGIGGRSAMRISLRPPRCMSWNEPRRPPPPPPPPPLVAESGCAMAGRGVTLVYKLDSDNQVGKFRE